MIELLRVIKLKAVIELKPSFALRASLLTHVACKASAMTREAQITNDGFSQMTQSLSLQDEKNVTFYLLIIAQKQ